MSADFMLTAEELRLKRRKRRRVLVVVLLLLIVIVAGYFCGRPAMNAIKSWQARRHAQKAFDYIDKEKWLEARNEATAAYQLRSTEPQALRAVARFLSRTRQVEALDFWKQLRDRQPLTREDQRDEAAIAIMAAETTRADVALNELMAAKPEPADWLLAAQLSIHKGVPEDALSSLEKVFNDSRTTEREQFQAALLELASPTNQDHADDAWSRVEKLSRGQSATALDALVVLARRALSKPEGTSEKPITDNREPITSEALARALETHPLAKAAQKLVALDLLERVDPTQREALMARAIADWKSADAASLTALATWLNGKDEYQRELDTIPLEKALQNRDLFLQHLDALGALERWNEVKDLLDADRFPLEPVIQKMYLARCNAQLGEKTAAENNWQRALEAAGGDPAKLMMVAEYAEKNGLLEVASSAYNAATEEAPKLRAAQQGRLRVAQASGDTKTIHAVLADMLRLWPNDPAIQNDEAYLRLLLMNSQPAQVPITNNPPSPGSGVAGQELITIAQLAEQLVQRDPASMPHRTLLALARLRQNRAADALAVYANIQLTPRALTPSALAIHAVVLSANKRSDDAKTEAAQIKIDNLLSEERALIEKVTSDQ